MMDTWDWSERLRDWPRALAAAGVAPVMAGFLALAGCAPASLVGGQTPTEGSGGKRALIEAYSNRDVSVSSEKMSPLELYAFPDFIVEGDPVFLSGYVQLKSNDSAKIHMSSVSRSDGGRNRVVKIDLTTESPLLGGMIKEREPIPFVTSQDAWRKVLKELGVPTSDE